MTLNEAIQIKTCSDEDYAFDHPDKIDEADNLSIECLKWRQRCEKLYSPRIYPLLPGQTRK